MPDRPALYVADTIARQLVGLPARPWEVGGWLLGYWAADRSALVVTHATPPARRGSPFGVWISGDGHRERFDEAWDASGGHVTFLGDWHTHPGGPALPSARDERAAAQLATEGDYGTPQPLIAITALPRWKRGRRAERRTRWHLGSSGGTLCELTPRSMERLPPAAAGVPQWAWRTSASRPR